jgi:hypothetical protein
MIYQKLYLNISRITRPIRKLGLKQRRYREVVIITGHILQESRDGNYHYTLTKWDQKSFNSLT